MHTLKEKEPQTGQTNERQDDSRNPSPESAQKKANKTMSDNTAIKIENQLGSFEFTPEQALSFPNGLIGFAGLESFALANLPGDESDQFKVLQCLEIPELSFIVLPYAAEGSLLADKDITEVTEKFQIKKEDLALLFIITIRSTGENMKVTMNLRAPVVVDTKSRTGRQYILSDQSYSVQHEL